MAGYYTIVLSQVLILFVLIITGYGCGKAKLFSSDAVRGMTSLVLYVVTPCVIVNSFVREFDHKMIYGLGITLVCAFLIHAGSILLAKILIHDKEKSKEIVVKFAIIFSNCGFMSLPLQQALLGEDGVFYGAVFVAVFNIMAWSYGVSLMGGGMKSLSLKKILLNPGLIGVTLGVIIFIFSIKLPTVLLSPIQYLAALNTPLPMLIIGYHLAESNILHAFKHKICYVVAGLRLIVIPLASLGLMYLCGIRGDVLVSCTIAASAPVAATTTMFSLKFERDADLSVKLVSVTTVLSAVTMPLIVALSQSIS